MQATVLVVPHHPPVVHQRDFFAEVENIPVLLLRVRVYDLEATLVKNLLGRKEKKKREGRIDRAASPNKKRKKTPLVRYSDSCEFWEPRRRARREETRRWFDIRIRGSSG